MKNKEHSDLVHEYKKVVKQINHYLISIQIEKNKPWDMWYPWDLEHFIRTKKQSIGDYRMILKKLVKKSKELKQLIKQNSK